MTIQTFFVGADIVVDESGLKILELQSIFDSNIFRAIELTGKNPLDRLLKSVRKARPELKIDLPEMANTKEKAREASLKKDDNTIPNCGIEAMLDAKYLFYLFCNHHPELAGYIPTTQVVTLSTLEQATLLSTSSLILGKPAASARGIGIQLFQSHEKTIPSLHSEIKRWYLPFMKSPMKISPSGFATYPVVLQQYLHSGDASQPISKPVIRVYAAITISDTGEINVAIDINSAYQHIRITQNDHDYTIENNHHIACAFDETEKTSIVSQLKRFFNVFFQKLLEETTYPSSKNMIAFKEWEAQLKLYLRDASRMDDQQRLNLLSLFTAALLSEQTFTANRLSNLQCRLLVSLISQFGKRDNQLFLNLIPSLTNALNNLVYQNFCPYQDDDSYEFKNIILVYNHMLLSLPESDNKKKLLEGFAPSAAFVKPEEVHRFYSLGL